MGVTPEDLDLVNRQLAEIQGRSLIRFRMGGGVLLEFSGDPYHQILVEGRLCVSRPGRVERYADPVTAEVAEAIIPLLNADTTMVSLSPDGSLTIGFGDVRLVAEPDEMYESWQVRADNDLLLVCVPGGDVAIWLPDREV
ncbi:hypothetical protein Q0Z83_027240 [Actinoplanes sichuanensis]|uniref:DUF6188 family protein n=1 Tax=Actinoplanes sichuanensis TaxID=512349 RepID=A0ABW4AXS6_9ACTN|nr:DUF6188 family protein [Actinoplanes sichuanensis]BEL04533.1 hypothetical protein Q0Z83_027240 [Actinoplanes sichuanensis]